MSKKIINDTKAPEAVGTYSQGVECNGVYYFSGQIGLDPQTGKMQEGVKAQLDQVLKNIDFLLEGTNLTREHILKTSIFLQDLGDFSLINEAYTEYFTAPFPARSCIQAAALPKGALVEIEVIATKNL